MVDQRDRREIHGKDWLLYTSLQRLLRSWRKLSLFYSSLLREEHSRRKKRRDSQVGILTDGALVQTGGRLHRWRAYTGRKHSRQRRSEGGCSRLRKMEGQARSRASASGIHSPYSRAARFSQFRSRKTVASTVTRNIQIRYTRVFHSQSRAKKFLSSSIV